MNIIFIFSDEFSYLADVELPDSIKVPEKNEEFDLAAYTRYYYI